MASVFWFTRDLRLQDNPALNLAVATGEGKVAAVYVVNGPEYAGLEGIRQHSLTESLKALDASLGGRLNVFSATDAAETAEKLAIAATNLGAGKVLAMRLHDPAGKKLQNTVGHALAARGIHLILEGSAYAVAPGTVRKPDETPYRVYTPFFKAWDQVNWGAPVSLPTEAGGVKNEWRWIADATGIPQPTKPAPFAVKAGEAFALRTWERFKHRALNQYDELRNRADVGGTSHLSHALAFGEIHPRMLLAELASLGDRSALTIYRKELAWREFYADVLWHNPHTVTDYYEPRFAGMRYDTGALADERLEAWKQGKTGYPMVDAGMRQLLATGWMHNRVRMIVASFLVKDLHLEWQQGAAWFEANLSDFDVASNVHGWQWTAGCGTDASPYYRIFNPILQGLKFDPNGEYVRKYVPELAHLDGADVHTPWEVIGGYSGGYAARIVDHDVERNESLARLEEIKIITKAMDG
jgi:deoxyribodipyrimidine photo-lyase